MNWGSRSGEDLDGEKLESREQGISICGMAAPKAQNPAGLCLSWERGATARNNLAFHVLKGRVGNQSK